MLPPKPGPNNRTQSAVRTPATRSPAHPPQSYRDRPQISPNPANTRAGQIYSLRAECESDAKHFLDEAEAEGFLLSSTVYPDQDGLPDVEIELVSNATLEQLRSVIRRMPDGHVMLQTLRQVPLAGNSLERDESFN